MRTRRRPVGFASGRRRAVARTERGETLVETLVTIALLGMTVVALLAGFVTVARLVDRNNRVTHAGNTAQSYAEQLKQPVNDTVANMEYEPCATSYPSFQGTLPGSAYTAEVESVLYANPIAGGGSATVNWSSSCTIQDNKDNGLQLMVVEVTVDAGDADIVESVPDIKRDARCNYSTSYENTDLGPC